MSPHTRVRRRLRWLVCAAATVLTACGNATAPTARPVAAPSTVVSGTPSARPASASPTPTPRVTRTPVEGTRPPQKTPTRATRSARPPTLSPTPASPTWWQGTIALPAHGSRATPLARIVASVAGDARLGCVWLVEEGTLKRRALLWPTGYRAAFAPLRIYDPNGRIVWREGEVRSLGGGASPVHVERIPRACRVGDSAWWLPGAGTPYEP
jgi:hypothetical protein